MVWTVLGIFMIVMVGGACALFGLSAGMDSVATFESHDAELTCFHCGRSTEVGREYCQQCGKELQ
jgi:hypothetical protein